MKKFLAIAMPILMVAVIATLVWVINKYMKMDNGAIARDVIPVVPLENVELG